MACWWCFTTIRWNALGGDGRNVEDLTLCELQSLPLFGSDARIPTFAEALERIDGRVPLIVEIKHEERYRESVQKTVEALRWYKGLYCIESFNPFALRELRRIAPEIPRGQLAAGLADSARDVGPLIGFALANLLTNCLSRPDFVAYDVNHMGAWQIWVQRRFFRTAHCSVDDSHGRAGHGNDGERIHPNL